MGHNITAEIAIIIVNFRTAEMLINCLSMMIRNLNFSDLKIVIVDNNSKDGSVEKIESWILSENLSDNLFLVKSSLNGGFSAGNNIGIKSINANYYLLLNSDAYIQSESINVLREKIRSDPSIGVVSPRLTWRDGTPQESTFNLFHPITEFVIQANTGFITNILKKYFISEPVNDTPRDVPWTSFACVMISHECINRVGLLDEGYFMYFEDVEYCLRTARNQYRIFHEPSASAVHLRGGSSSVKKNARLKKRLPKYYYESRARFYYQKSGLLGLLAANIAWYLGTAVSILRQLAGRKDKKTIKRQWYDIWANFTSPLGSYTHPEKK